MSWAGCSACVEWSSGFAILLREVRNYYMILKVLSLKLKKDFPLLGLCRSWEVLSTYCSHDLRALTSMASLQSLDGRSTEGPVQPSHLSKPQWHFIHRVPKPHAVPSGFGSLPVAKTCWSGACIKLQEVCSLGSHWAVLSFMPFGVLWWTASASEGWTRVLPTSLHQR